MCTIPRIVEDYIFKKDVETISGTDKRGRGPAGDSS